MDWRRVAGLGVVSVALAVPALVVGLPFAARAFVGAIVLMLNGCIWFAVSLSAGVSVWTLMAGMIRTTADALATPQASGALAGLVVVGAGALYGLQRLLAPRDEEES